MNKEKREKPLLFRRVIAYLIDFLIVALLSSAISMVFFKENTGQSRMEQFAQLVEKLNNKEITQEEYQEQSNEINYYMAKETVGTTIVMCSVGLVYHVILCFFCHGITLGKFIMRLRLVSANEKELNMGNYLIRGLLVNFILSYLLNITCVYAMDKATFINVYYKLSMVLTLFLLVTMLFVMYREDGRGLHDLLSNTKVISTKEPKIKEENKEEVKEAKVVEEKAIEEKTTKKTTKKSTKKEVKKK